MRYVNKLMATAGGGLIAVIMFVIVAEVLSRSFAGRSVEGSFEIVGLCLALCIFLSFSPCEEADGHIKVRLLEERLPIKIRAYQNVVVYTLAFVVFAIVTWQVGRNAISSFQVGEVLPGAHFRVPVYPAKLVSVVGLGIFCIQLFVGLIRRVRMLR